MTDHTVLVRPQVRTTVVRTQGRTVVRGVPAPAAKGDRGDPGPVGPTGPEGPVGPSGALAALFYEHDQAVPSDTWVITHPLGFKPAIDCVDSAGTRVEGSYEWPDDATVIARFSIPFGGRAYLR